MEMTDSQKALEFINAEIKNAEDRFDNASSMESANMHNLRIVKLRDIRTALQNAEKAEFEPVMGSKADCDAAKFDDCQRQCLQAQQAYLSLKSKAQGLVKALENIIKHQRTIIPTIKGAAEIIAEEALQAFSHSSPMYKLEEANEPDTGQKRFGDGQVKFNSDLSEREG